MGPAASVLLSEFLTNEQKHELEVWIKSLTIQIEGNVNVGDSFWFKEDTFSETVSQCCFDLSISDPAESEEESSIAQVVEYLGYYPPQEIVVSSGCNQPSDHRMLGHMVLHLAEVYHGLIAMGGAITPPSQTTPPPLSKDFFKEQQANVEARKAFLRARMDANKAKLPPGTIWLDYLKEHYHDPDSPFKKVADDMREQFGPALPERWEPSLEEISVYVHGIPGTDYEIYYERANGKLWVYHIVDTTFMESWLHNPRFRMIK